MNAAAHALDPRGPAPLSVAAEANECTAVRSGASPAQSARALLRRKARTKKLKWPGLGTVEEQVWTRCRDGVLAHDIYSELGPTGVPRRSLITYVSNYRRWNRGGVKRAQRVLEYHPDGFLTIPLDAETWAIYQLEAVEQRIAASSRFMPRSPVTLSGDPRGRPLA